MRNAGDHYVRFFAFDFIVDRREIGRVRRNADVVDNLQANLRQTFQVLGIKRSGPGRVFAHDHRALKVQILDQKFLRRVAGRIGDTGRGRVAVERIFEVIIVLGDVLGDHIGGGRRA